ncbi:hypothetical protein [Lysinibacillus xylanilyticus]|uniref:hypothetical protein n=1 Tax=Lysinibacillus xylanilyticus TaxID=582475 RepID=UPI003D0396F9
MRKQSGSYKCFGSESEATAIGFLSVRKRSDSNNNTRLSDQHRAADDATLALRFRAKNICCCRYVSTALSYNKHLQA